MTPLSMKPFVRPALILALAFSAALMLPAGPAEAKRIERACLSSDRQAATPQLCGCIQRVADQILTRSDQRLAARFFADPQMAQDIRQSDRDSHEQFWQRYRAFGTTAANVCG
jgi:hypothetical protein